MKHRLHISWFIGWSCLGFLGGAGLSAWAGNRIFLDTVLLLPVLALFAVCLIGRYRWMIILAVCTGCLAGLWRGSVSQAELSAYQPFYGSTVKVNGRVSQDASYGAKGDQRLNLKDIKIQKHPVKGEIWVSIAKADIKRGDIVTVKGQLGEGFGNVSATMYRAQVLEVTRPYPGDVARRVRDWFAGGVRQGIPDTQASLGLGYLAGQKTALPKDLEEDIRTTGLTHVVVASGYNLTILVVFSRRLFLRISKYAATVASTLLIISFMLITGLSPSMSRAGLVAGLGLLVWYYGRTMHPFVLLSFAAAATVMIQPSYLRGDLGWYLSFTSFVGVIVLAPLIHHYFWGVAKKPGIFRELLVGTLCAQVLTTPIILLSFGLLPVYALLANLLVLPLVPLAMLATFIAGIAGLLIPVLASIFAFPATVMLTYSTMTIEHVADLPNALIEITFNLPLMIAGYIGLGIAITYLKRRTKHDFRNPDSATEMY